MKTRSLIRLFACAGFAALFSAGCSEKSWRDEYSEADEAEQDYIQVQIDAGMTPEEAERQYNLRVIRYQTEGLQE